MQFHINALPLDQDSMTKLKSVANDWYSAQMRDSQQSYSWSWELGTPMPTGGRCAFVMSTDPSAKPEWLSQGAFDQAVNTGCAYCYRKKLFENARKVNYHVCKHFSMPGVNINDEALIAGAQPFSVRRALPAMAPFLPEPTQVACAGPCQSGSAWPAVLTLNSMARDDPAHWVPPTLATQGWKAAVDAQGRTYYQNVLTQETRWDLPAATGVGLPPPPSLLEVSGADTSQPQEPGGGVFCPSCGTAAGAGARFCLACGHALPHRS